MPQALDSCVESVLEGWRKNPGSAPKKNKQGQALDTPEKKRSAAFAMCTASLQKAGKMEYGDETWYFSEDLPLPNPVMTHFAMTNKPHIQGLDELGFVDGDGKPWVEGESQGEKLIKVPLLILGKWKHRLGILNFTKKLTERIEENFRAGKAGHQVGSDARHKDVLGSLAWATGKFFSDVSKKGLPQWGVLAKPTTQGEQFVRDKVFQYASIELHPNFKNRMLSAALSADDIVGEWADECPALALDEYYEEGDMPEGTEEVTLEQDLELQDQVDTLSTEGEETRGLLQATQDELRLANERLARMERAMLDQFVESIVIRAEAFRDESDHAHSSQFLGWLNSVLKLQPIGEGDNVIQLEDTSSPGTIVGYFRRAINWLAENVSTAGPIMQEAKTEPDKKPAIGAGGSPLKLSGEEEAEIDMVWGIVPGTEGGE